MHLRLLAVGKLRDRHLRALLDDYYGRIGRYSRFEEVELKDQPPAQLTAALTRACLPRSEVVALEVDGRVLCSPGLADWMEQAGSRGISALTFVIGGAYGLPQDFSARAQLRLSLSAMTLPHRLARLLLAEQLYRAFTIQRGEPYSH